ncbi:MAG TPA: sialidase family protein [Blastocatellia bacterium]|nr:sialidase family protein [Blastocatellia bacterium]
MKHKFTLSLFINCAIALCVAGTIDPTPAVSAGATTKTPSPFVEVSLPHRISASPDIAISPDGGINVIWVDKGEAKDAPATPPRPTGPQTGGHSHKTYNNLYFARSSDGGRTFSQPLRISSKDGELWGFATSRPRIAVAKSGVIHVFYHANRRDASASRQAVDARYSRSIDGGKTFTAPITLNSESGGLDDGELNEAHCFGGMGVAPNGDVHAFWIDTRHMTSEKENGSIYTAVSRNEGKTFERERMIFRATACPCCQLYVAFTPKGEVILSSRNVTPDGARDSSVAVSKDAGRTYSAFVATTPNKWLINACPLKPAMLATDKDGRIFAAWFSGVEKPAGSFFAISEDGGKSFSTPIALHAEASTPDRPQIAVSGDGGVTVAWDAVVGQVRRVYLRNSTDHGKTFGPVVELYGPPGAANYPAIASTSDAKTFVAWQQNNRILFKEVTPLVAPSR